jgi:hypothetical protein
MSDKGRDDSLYSLFKGQGRELINVKFYRGTDAVIAEETLNGAFVESVKRHREAANAGPGFMPKCKKKPVDLKRLVADM